MTPEPELDELSAYLDGALAEPDRRRLEDHLAGCEACRRRLGSLRSTVAAIRALPLETPPRAFTVPPQRRQGGAWQAQALAWLGGGVAAAAAAAVAIALVGGGVGGYGGASNASSSNQRSVAHDRGALQVQASGSQAFKGAEQTPFTHSQAVAGAGRQRLVMATDAATYEAGSQVRIQVRLSGLGATVQSVNLQVLVARGGQATLVPLTVSSSDAGLLVAAGTYQAPAQPGDYEVIGTWLVGDGSALVARLQVRVR